MALSVSGTPMRFDAAYHRRSPNSIHPFWHPIPYPLTSPVRDATEEPRMTLMEINLGALTPRNSTTILKFMSQISKMEQQEPRFDPVLRSVKARISRL